MLARRFAALLVLLVVAGCGGGGSEEQDTSKLTPEVREQLGYLDPKSSLVASVDLRYGEDNWDDLRPLASRLLRAARSRLGGQGLLLAPNLDGALEQAATFAGLNFGEDIKPVLDGHLVVGVVQEPRRRVAAGDAKAVAVYRTKDGDLRPLVERLLDGARPRPLPGFEDVELLEDGIALVGDRTLVFAASEGEVDGLPLLRAALERHKAGRGVPAERLETAGREAGIADPLVLATGDLTLAGALFEQPDVDRAREAVPYLRALRRGSVAFDIEPDRAVAKGTAITDGGPLRDEDLPVGPTAELDVPRTDVIGGASSNQSRTTVLGARVARALFADSRFVRAVERAERDLGIGFEEEVLAQFSCPSISVLEPRPASQGEGVRRFGARSCVRDPERLRALLPRLRPHLPAILTGLQGLGDAGLAGLLLIAPDAPLTPGALLADIVVRPFAGEDEEAGETLFEITGLRDDETSAIAQAGPDRVIFGFVGDAFVVASDPEMAREVAEAETERLDRRAGSVVRIPIAELVARDGDADEVTQVLGEVLRTLTATVIASPRSTVVEAVLPFAD